MDIDLSKYVLLLDEELTPAGAVAIKDLDAMADEWELFEDIHADRANEYQTHDKEQQWHSNTK